MLKAYEVSRLIEAIRHGCGPEGFTRKDAETWLVDLRGRLLATPKRPYRRRLMKPEFISRSLYARLRWAQQVEAVALRSVPDYSPRFRTE